MKEILVVVPEDTCTDSSMFQAGLDAALDECPDGYWEYSVQATASPEIENRVLVMVFTKPVDPQALSELKVRVIDSYQAQIEKPA